MSSGLSEQQLSAYLERVGLDSAPAADLDGLRNLHRAQFFTIPFENLDILLGLGIDLDHEAVFRKLVSRRRGGYCFELNGLMLRVLRTLGFEARPLLARVHLTDPPSGLTHQLNLVRIEDRPWVMDVGFGAGGPRVPLPLTEGVTETDVAEFELSRVEPWGWLLRTRGEGDWKPSYSFELSHVTAEDIEVGNHYTSTSPRTHFTRMAVVSLPTPKGRLSVRDGEVTEIEEGCARNVEIRSDAMDSFLRDRFGVELERLPPQLCTAPRRPRDETR